MRSHTRTHIPGVVRMRLETVIHSRVPRQSPRIQHAGGPVPAPGQAKLESQAGNLSNTSSMVHSEGLGRPSNAQQSCDPLPEPGLLSLLTRESWQVTAGSLPMGKYRFGMAIAHPVSLPAARGAAAPSRESVLRSIPGPRPVQPLLHGPHQTLLPVSTGRPGESGSTSGQEFVAGLQIPSKSERV
jgi:hypothetical protein